MTRTSRQWSGDSPTDRLTTLCKVMLGAAEADPLHRPGDQIIVLMGDREQGGTAAVGFEDDHEALAFLLAHVEAFAIARGLPFRLIDVGDPDDN